MKLVLIFCLFTLSVIVKGNLIAVAQPVMLALGTIFTAMNINQDVHDKQPIKWRNLLLFTNKATDEKS